jgi:large subunit ribosomal protein L25
MATTLHVQHREVSSRGELRRIRLAGQVPGVVYGKGLGGPSNISIDAKDLMAMLRSHPHAVVEIDVPGAGKHPVMMAELQRDSLTQQVMHIDFHRINMNEKIKTPARLEISGTSPGEKEGGVLQLVMHEVEIECYPKDIPDSIVIDVSELQMGEHLSIGDLKLPVGVAATQDLTTVIVAVLTPQKERTEEEVDVLEDEAEENEKHHDAAMAVEKD